MKAISIMTALLLISFLSFSQGIHEKNGLIYNEDGELLSGKYSQISEKESITTVFHYNHGFLHGDFLVYASNGILLEKGKYFDGQKHGKWTNWTDESIKTSEAKFNYGQRDGKWQIWDESGVLRYVMYYEVGDKVGTWQVYNETGSLQQEKIYTRTL